MAAHTARSTALVYEYGDIRSGPGYEAAQASYRIFLAGERAAWKAYQAAVSAANDARIAAELQLQDARLALHVAQAAAAR